MNRLLITVTEVLFAMKMIGFSASYEFIDGGYASVKYENHDTDREPRTYAIRLIGGFLFYLVYSATLSSQVEPRLCPLESSNARSETHFLAAASGSHS